VKPERCPRGHLLDDANTYEEKRPRGGSVYRCRKCRAAQRRAGRKTPKPRLSLADLVAHVQPSDDDIRRAVDMWANGTAGQVVRDAGHTATELADAAGIHPHTAREWMRGKRNPQARHQQAAAAVLLALGALRSNGPSSVTDGYGDQLMLVGGRPDRNGPWHASPPHHGRQMGLSENWFGSGNPTGARWADYFPCVGMIGSHAESQRLVAAHGYTADPRALEYASACHGTPGWKHDCPGCTGVQVATAAWSIHMADLYAGQGCQPGCPHGRAEHQRQPTA
jgi:hypothetical protein